MVPLDPWIPARGRRAAAWTTAVCLPALAMLTGHASGLDAQSAANQRTPILVYSVTGYELHGAKRALVRAANAGGSASVDAARSRWRLRDGHGTVVEEGTFVARPTTFGMPLWEADFSSLSHEGRYVLEASPVNAAGTALDTLRGRVAVREVGPPTRRYS